MCIVVCIQNKHIIFDFSKAPKKTEDRLKQMKEEADTANERRFKEAAADNQVATQKLVDEVKDLLENADGLKGWSYRIKETE